MKMAGITFEEVVIPLRQPETAAAITRHSPAGKVPILKHGARVLWESIAILEYLAEMLPNERLWPADVAARAHARVISAEMHAGFQALRSNMPMDVRTSKPGRGMNPDVASDIARITDIWHDCRARFGGEGPFLFGRFCNADAMWAPVVTRFETYGVILDEECSAYCRTILNLPPMQEWYAAARAEAWAIADYDAA